MIKYKLIFHYQCHKTYQGYNFGNALKNLSDVILAPVHECLDLFWQIYRNLHCTEVCYLTTPWRSNLMDGAVHAIRFLCVTQSSKEKGAISNRTLCISRKDKQLIDLPAEEITKMILEGIFLPENIQYIILIKP